MKNYECLKFIIKKYFGFYAFIPFELIKKQIY